MRYSRTLQGIVGCLVAGVCTPCAWSQPASIWTVEIRQPETARQVLVSAPGPGVAGVVEEEDAAGGLRVLPTQQVGETLQWIIETEAGQPAVRRFRFRAQPADPALNLRLDEGAEALRVLHEEQPLLAYHHGHQSPPPGVDPVYGRSGFIHPLWSPQGQVLTRIQPPDHYHHYGIWNPWTQVEFRGRTVDFWNLAKREGTVRFAGFIRSLAGPVQARYQARHQHVVLQADGAEEVAIDEVQSVTVYRPNADRTRYLIDLVIELRAATDVPVRLLEYRYGGLGWRATEGWHRGNSHVLTSEGLGRAQADGSLARWCRVQGVIDNELSGIVLMSHPTNYNHPEPLRVWPENAEKGRGDLFVNFSPTKNRDWVLAPGEAHRLRYRLLVFSGPVEAPEAEAAWNDFAEPVVGKVR